MQKAMRSFITALAVGLAIASMGLIQGCHKAEDDNAPPVGQIGGKAITPEGQAILDRSKNDPNKEQSPFQKGPK